MGKSSKGKAKQKAKTLQTTAAKKTMAVNDAATILPKATPAPVINPVVPSSGRERRVMPQVAAPTTTEKVELEIPTVNVGFVLHTVYGTDNKPRFSKIKSGNETYLQYHANNPNSIVYPIGTQVSFDTYTYNGQTKGCNNVKVYGENKKIANLISSLEKIKHVKEITMAELFDLALQDKLDVNKIVCQHDGRFYV